MKEQLLNETGGKCAHCGTPLNRYTNLTIDHVIPLNKGGTNGTQNLTVLCKACNEQKSDMILPPMSWYPFLSSKRRKALTEILHKYMKDTDYLAEDCLVPIDAFRIEVPVTAVRKCGKGIRVVRMPAYINGIRMECDDAFAWLMEYKRSLQYREARGVIAHPSEFSAPCYLLKKGDIELAMANPWLVHEWDEDINNYRNEIIIDWFFMPSLPNRDYLPEMLSGMVAGMETYIMDSISATMEGACAVLFHNRCFVSDKFSDPVFNMISYGRKDEIHEFDTKYALTSRLRVLSTLHILGEKKAVKELRNKMKGQNPDGTTTLEEAMKENNNFNNRFKKDGEL